jgi:hypothetical protein
LVVGQPGSEIMAIGDFNLPPTGAARYLAIDTNDGKRHHVEMYSPERLHPEKGNYSIWSAYNLNKVCLIKLLM